MKKLCYSAFIAFLSSISTMLAMHALADHHQQAGEIKNISLTEVAKHNTESDCWMAIEGKVYNLTEYLSKHPAGPGTMVPWCGIEASDGMRTKGIGSDHSDFAWKALESYLIGTVN